ncbi:MAG: GNAT family N-acetyltransferase [Variibacter sp.]|nr:GNAT family N-acetyltransferase [Variibacter sp.]
MQDLLPHGGTVRQLFVAEAEAYRDHLLRLDPDSRHSRFGGGVSNAFIENYARRPFALDAVLHGFFVDGALRGAAELRPVRSPLDQEAEAAFSIEKPWQSHGVGSALLSHTLLAARNRGIRSLHMICLADNRRMQQLARKFDAELSFEYGSVIGAVEAPYPTPLTMLREAVMDSASFATAMLDVQARLIKNRPRFA